MLDIYNNRPCLLLYYIGKHPPPRSTATMRRNEFPDPSTLKTNTIRIKLADREDPQKHMQNLVSNVRTPKPFNTFNTKALTLPLTNT